MTGLMRCRDMTLRSSVTAGYTSGEETLYAYVALSKIKKKFLVKISFIKFKIKCKNSNTI